MKIVITFGTYDLFHKGHLNIINRAKNLGDKLIVGVSTDQLNYNKKQKYPIYSQEDRKDIISNLKAVDNTFFEESLEKKRDYILKYKANILVMGDDWEGRFDEFKDICEVLYLPRTPNISSTEVKEIIRSL
jgi:glycerol-3-phosphate cytidylyltransferase